MSDVEPLTTTPPEVTPSRRGGRTALTIATLVGIVVAMLVVLLVTRDPAVDRLGDSPLLGRVAPAVDGTTLDGGHVSMDDYRGRWVVLNFMASWCTPCRTEHPELLAFDEAHRERGDAVLIGVTFGDTDDDARAFFTELGGDWPVVSDLEDGIGVAYGVTQPPETFLITPGGEVAHRITGATTRAELEAVIAAFERGTG